MKKRLLLNIVLIPFIGFAQLQTIFQSKIDSIYEKKKTLSELLFTLKHQNKTFRGVMQKAFRILKLTKF